MLVLFGRKREEKKTKGVNANWREKAESASAN